MDISQRLAEVKKYVDEAKNILLVIPKNSSHDGFGSALASYLALTDIGKTVTVACPDPMTVEYSDFVGANKVKTSIQNKNFIISLDYKEGSIDKVSYNIEGDKFNLVIEPRAGFQFSKDAVSYSHATGGAKADLIIVFNALHLGQLGTVYEENKDLFASQPVVNIDTHSENKEFGTVNLVDPTASSTTELTAVVLSSLGVKLTEDIATNLLNALYQTTDNFEKSLVNARTFEVASVCMKAGGKRFTKKEKTEEGKSANLIQPKPQEDKKDHEETVLSGETKQPEKPSSPPDDWLKPKIFKSSSHE